MLLVRNRRYTVGQIIIGDKIRMARKHKTPWQALQMTYERKGLVLVLGAGVSVGSGVPAWDELLARLAEGALGGTAVYEELRVRGFSQTAVAGALEQLYGSRQSFIAALKNKLYDSLPFTKAPEPETDSATEFVNHICTNNSTLRAVAAFCSSFSGGYLPNRRVPCVVSFNLDSLLETFTTLRYGRQLMRTIDHAAVATAPSYISSYHVHGYIPFGHSLRETSTNVVLTEQDYFDFFGNPLSVFTYTFLHLLREHSCLFVGMSMRDDNVRRLLHYSARERRTAFSIVAGSLSEKDVTRRHYAILARSSDSTDEVIEKALITLGVRTLWLDSYDQLPDYLAFVYEGGSESWKAVWSPSPCDSQIV